MPLPMFDGAAAAEAASSAPASGVATGAASKRTQSTSPVADMGPFLRGEVLAVRADPEEDAESPFWVCAIHGVRKNELDATWCVRQTIDCLRSMADLLLPARNWPLGLPFDVC